MSFQYANCNRECDCCDAQDSCQQHDAILYRDEKAEVEELVREQHPPEIIIGTVAGDLEERITTREDFVNKFAAAIHHAYQGSD